MSSYRYYLPSYLNDVVCQLPRNSCTCVHLNARSIRNKVSCLEEFFTEFSFKYSAVMLTWRSNEMNVFKLSSYRTFYLNRQSGRGGDIALLISDTIQCELFGCFTRTTHDYEVLCVRANNTVFSVCYRPPHGDNSAFLGFYDQFLAYMTENKHILIAGGDFNIDVGSTSYFS